MLSPVILASAMEQEIQSYFRFAWHTQARMHVHLQLKDWCTYGNSTVPLEGTFDHSKHLFSDRHLEWVIVARALMTKFTCLYTAAQVL